MAVRSSSSAGTASTSTPLPKWEQALEKLNAYSLRERALLFLCVLAVIIGCWQFFLELPREQSREQMQQQRGTIASDLKKQQAQFEAISSVGGGEAPTRELVQLQNQISQLDESLASLAQGLVSVDQLPEILQEVLISTTELKLHRVRTLPVQELRLEGGSADSSAPSTGVYRHTVELEVSGDYFEVMNFLRRLEDLSWRFYWDQLDYEVTDYPRAEMRLRVYTLSAEEGLLGV